MKTTKGESNKKSNGRKGGNMGQHKVEEGRKSCRCKWCYEKYFTSKERVSDLNSVKVEREEVMKTRGTTSSSNVTDIKRCNRPSLTLITVSSRVVAED